MKRFFRFACTFIVSFSISWCAIDMWKLLHGNMTPLRRKGIQVMLIVNNRQQEDTLTDVAKIARNDNTSLLGLRVTYTYSEAAIIKNTD